MQLRGSLLFFLFIFCRLFNQLSDESDDGELNINPPTGIPWCAGKGWPGVAALVGVTILVIT